MEFPDFEFAEILTEFELEMFRFFRENAVSDQNLFEGDVV